MRKTRIKSLAVACLLGAPLSAVYAEANLPKDASSEETIRALISHIRESDKKIEALTQKIAILEAAKNKKQNNNATVKKVSVSTESDSAKQPKKKKNTTTKKTNAVKKTTKDGELRRYNATSTPVGLLKARQANEKAFAKQGKELPASDIQVGGNIAVSTRVSKGYTGKTHNDLNIGSPTLGVAAIAGEWLSGQIKLGYIPKVDDDEADSVVRANKSRVFVNTAYLTIGNLDRSPFYASAGQMILPFSNDGSAFAAPSLTTRLGQMRSRALLLGYQPTGDNNVYGSIYGFKGDAFKMGDRGINNGGFAVGYHLVNPGFKLDTNVNYILNIADASTMQNNRSPLIESGEIIYDEDTDDIIGIIIHQDNFTGFGASRAMEQLDHRVGGISAAAKLTVQSFSFLADYTGAARKFSEDNLTFNEKGAQPQAVNFEASYNFEWLNRKNAISVGYDRTFEALAFNLPEQSYKLGYKIRIWKNLTGNVTYKHDVNYGVDDYATGQGLPVLADKGLGKKADSVVGQLSFAF